MPLISEQHAALACGFAKTGGAIAIMAASVMRKSFVIGVSSGLPPYNAGLGCLIELKLGQCGERGVVDPISVYSTNFHAPAPFVTGPISRRVHPPCLTTLACTVPDGPQWAHETTGYRLIRRRHGDRVRLFTRRGHDWTGRVPRIAGTLAGLQVRSATIDGEAVVCDAAGVSDFDRLRSALARRGSREPFLYAFDLVELGGQDMRRQPWAAHRAGMRSGRSDPVT